jgi:hypothetical protein
MRKRIRIHDLNKRVIKWLMTDSILINVTGKQPRKGGALRELNNRAHASGVADAQQIKAMEEEIKQLKEQLLKATSAAASSSSSSTSTSTSTSGSPSSSASAADVNDPAAKQKIIAIEAKLQEQQQLLAKAEQSIQNAVAEERAKLMAEYDAKLKKSMEVDPQLAAEALKLKEEIKLRDAIFQKLLKGEDVLEMKSQFKQSTPPVDLEELEALNKKANKKASLGDAPEAVEIQRQMKQISRELDVQKTELQRERDRVEIERKAAKQAQDELMIMQAKYTALEQQKSSGCTLL